MHVLRDWLIGQGLSATMATALAILAAIALSLAIGLALRGVARVPLKKLLERWGRPERALKRHGVATKISWVIAVVIAEYLVLPQIEPWQRAYQISSRLLDGLAVITVSLALTSLISAFIDVMRYRDEKQYLPYKVLGQAAQVIVWVYAAVALLSVFSGKDVSAVLTGLTAVGAILVYIFRDTILGWTAGIQLAANDLVREGDWVSLPRFRADGIVEEISLTTVQVRNWDKTIHAIPTYSMLSEGFRNWRGMYESKGRRIKRSLNIDASTVRFSDDALIERLRSSALLRDLPEMQLDSAAASDPLSGPRPTNIGLFRSWLRLWLANHPEIHDDMTSMVRELQPSTNGVPVEIYVFSKEQRWEHYETLQASIVDHVLAVLPVFGLRVFQKPTGHDLRDGDV